GRRLPSFPTRRSSDLSPGSAPPRPFPHHPGVTRDAPRRRLAALARGRRGANPPMSRVPERPTSVLSLVDDLIDRVHRAGLLLERSEERRVGKGGGVRW